LIFAPALGTHRTAVHLHQLMDNRQPQSKPALPAQRRFFALTETLEDVRQKLRIDATPRILNRDLRLGVHAFKPHFDAPAFGRELDGVREKIPKDLLQAMRVALDLNMLTAELYVNLNALRLG